MKKIPILVVFLLLVLACTSKPRVNTDPFYEGFYEKTRLIMSDEEIEIYKHLPDAGAKEEFIAEFWKKRDPNPDTEENEVKEDFIERIAYANRWFNENRSKNRGWDTERGRILLQLGFPDEREWGEVPLTDSAGRLLSTQRVPLERWIYYEYTLYLEFIGDFDGFGTFKLRRIPVNLRTSLDLAKARMDYGTGKKKKGYFKFSAEFKADNIIVVIPAKRVTFEDKEGRMNAEFKVQVSVYRDYRKVRDIDLQKTFTATQEEILASKEITFDVAYSPDQPGEYYFDIIIVDKLSDSRYRNFCKFKK